MPTAPPRRDSSEYVALERLPKETATDALARVGDDILTDVGGSELRDRRPNKKLPKQLAALVGLRAQGYDNKEIADKLRIKAWRLRTLIATARREYGWSDLGSQLQDQAVPLAIASTLQHLEYEGSAEGVKEGRFQATPATLRGLGVFKSHTAAKVEKTEQTTHVLRVEIALPEAPPGSVVAVGRVLATPRRAARLDAPVSADPAP